MKKRNLLTKSTRLEDLSFDDLMEEINDHLDDKITRLQTRRWRKIKRQLA